MATSGAGLAGLTVEEQRAVEAFRRDVVEPSMSRLIILDFWAEWCGPCKQLGPVLEKVAADYADRGVTLVKIDVDANSFIAAQFQVRSIPTVYAMFQGRPVADLTPARTEAQLTAALDQILAQLPIGDGADGGGGGAEGEAELAAEVENVLAMAEDALAAGDAEEAYGAFASVLQAMPERRDALGGLVRALVAIDRVEEAEAMLAGLDAAAEADPAIQRARAALAIAAERADPEELTALRRAVEAAPDDHQARFDLAAALMANGDRDGAADALLAIIAAERDWNDGAARAKLLTLFETIGLEDPWVAATRRRLSAALFG